MKAVRKTSVARKRMSNLAFLAGHGYVLGAITPDKFPIERETQATILKFRIHCCAITSRCGLLFLRVKRQVVPFFQQVTASGLMVLLIGIDLE
ncbi:hypothetical protein TNCT_697781 [Trichonephila clavata]|uniref:Uncharacterized protein n=1 Tax=Trichonephila clavata TaxID=2740835 RepID=A0A8X6HV16_TRICU|nr:hypothetical protein TNCT_697781 [Trichonephila clavata]